LKLKQKLYPTTVSAQSDVRKTGVGLVILDVYQNLSSCFRVPSHVKWPFIHAANAQADKAEKGSGDHRLKAQDARSNHSSG
jgi:hypothetical protein